MQQKRVTLANGIELDVVDTGPSDAEVLIFLHGFPESHRTWRHQIAQFSDRYRCIAPDQRGYRGSSNPQDPDMYSTDKLIGDIFLLADALNVAEFTIVGHDWGGAIAWGVALGGQAMGRVKRAVIANAPHPAIFQKLLYTDRIQREASQYISAFRDPSHDAFIRKAGLAAFLNREAEWESATPMETKDRAIQLEDWADPDTRVAMLNWYRGSAMVIPSVDAPYELPADYSPPSLPNLTIPTLVIWAMDDLALPSVNLQGMDDVVDDMRLVEIPDCGHFVSWEAPEKFNAALEGFLAETSG